MTLDALFGACALPAARAGFTNGNGLKSFEVDGAGQVRVPRSRSVLNPGSVDALKALAALSGRNPVSQAPETVLFLWLIDDQGTFVLAMEELTCGDARPRHLNLQGLEALGHPTLIDGKSARIGGELFLEAGIWYLTNKSGRYSFGRGWNDQQVMTLLTNVADLCKGHGLDVICKVV